MKQNIYFISPLPIYAWMMRPGEYNENLSGKNVMDPALTFENVAINNKSLSGANQLHAIERQFS